MFVKMVFKMFKNTFSLIFIHKNINYPFEFQQLNINHLYQHSISSHNC